MSHKLIKSGVIVATMTFLSRILGFARDVIFARVFAASAGMDAFLIAFKIPNFMRRLFAEGAFNQAFIPTIGEYKAKKDSNEVKDLIAHVQGTLGGILFLITLTGILLAPVLVMIFAPGYVFSDNNVQLHQYELTVSLLKITFPYIFFISLVAFAGGILNTYGKFALPAFTPVLLNIVLIASVFYIVPKMDEPVTGLAIGVFIAGLCQLLLQLPFLAKMGLLVRPKWNWHHPGLKKIRQLMLPALFGASIAQISLLLDIMLASLLVTGSISWLYYSDRLMEFPLGILGVALATVILPSLSRDHARQSTEKFSKTLDKALRWAVYLGAPAALGLALLASPIITALFANDNFARHDVMMSSLSLIAYSCGLPGFILVKVLLPGFYSRQDTKTPVKIGIIALSVNMFFNIVIVVPWTMMDVPGAHAGLAAATSISALTNAFLLYRGLRKSRVYQPQSGWLLLSLRVIAALIVMSVLLLLFNNSIEHWIQMPGWERVQGLFIQIIAAMICYFGVLRLSGVDILALTRKTI